MDDRNREAEEGQESTAGRAQSSGDQEGAIDESGQQGDFASASSSLSTPDDGTNPTNESEPPIIVSGG